MTVDSLAELLEDLGEHAGERYYESREGKLALANIIDEVDDEKSGTIDFFEFMNWWREVSVRLR